MGEKFSRLTVMFLSGLALLSASLASPADADVDPGKWIYKQGNAYLRDFHYVLGPGWDRFNRGGQPTIEELQAARGLKVEGLRIQWVIFGTPKFDGRGKITNAVLYCHGTGGSAHLPYCRKSSLYDPGGPLDLRTHCVIATSAIGAGQDRVDEQGRILSLRSSRPSDGLHMKFPQFNLEDIVNAQYLVLRRLGVDHLLAVYGTSGGGRNTWQWAVQYPDFMDACIPFVSDSQALIGHRLMFDIGSIEPILRDPRWNNGEYLDEDGRPTTEQPPGLALAGLVRQLPFTTWERALVAPPGGPTPEETMKNYLGGLEKFRRSHDANDYIYQIRMNIGFDAYSQLHRVKVPILAINGRDDWLTQPRSKLEATIKKLREVARVPAESYLVSKPGAVEYGHGACGVDPDGTWVPVFTRFWRTYVEPDRR